MARTAVEDDASSRSLPDVPQAHLFEREIAEQYGVRPEGHPWLKPVRFHPSYRDGHDAWGRPAGTAILPGVTDFFRVEGSEIHEVAVGPVHAGVIEPGHFRFQCHGEHVFHLEIALGYQHRGIERALVGRADETDDPLHGDRGRRHDDRPHAGLRAGGRGALRRRGVRHARRRSAASRSSSSGWPITPATSARSPATSAYLPTASFCGRLRGDFLNMTAELCGSRFGRGLVRPGGVGFDLERRQVDDSAGRASSDARPT